MRLNALRLVGGLSSLVLAGLSAYWAWGEVIAIGPRVLISQARSGVQPDVQRDWVSSYEALSRALEIKPSDARLHYEAGTLARWRAVDLRGDPERHPQWLASSLGHLETAVSFRPTWGQAWAVLANVRLEAGDRAGARSALVRAMTLEPYEGATRPMIFWTGFAIWGELSPGERIQLVRLARAALLDKSYQHVMEPAVTFRLESVIALLIVGDEEAVRNLQRFVRDRELVTGANPS